MVTVNWSGASNPAEGGGEGGAVLLEVVWEGSSVDRVEWFGVVDVVTPVAGRP
jgi:hypothetical protein